MGKRRVYDPGMERAKIKDKNTTFSVIGIGLLVVGYRLLVIGFQLSVLGFACERSGYAGFQEVAGLGEVS
jgi:hypothetical protein